MSGEPDVCHGGRGWEEKVWRVDGGIKGQEE